MLRPIFTIFILLFLHVSVSAQQNDEFKQVKDYFDYQRFMLSQEFGNKIRAERNSAEKVMIEKDYLVFMSKLDSVQNTALLGALIKVKNREDLAHLYAEDLERVELEVKKKAEITEDAKYPGGFNNLREQIAAIFYSEGVLPRLPLLSTTVEFVVERDGSIARVKAAGENFIFNRQAEIAVYLLPERFSPAKIKGVPVRYRFRLPLSMNLQ